MSGMSDYDNEHYDPMYGYDDDGEEYIDMYDDDGDYYCMDYETYQGDYGYDPSEYVPTIRGRLLLLRWRIGETLHMSIWTTRQYGGVLPYLKWKFIRTVHRIEHNLRMRFDKPYKARYDEIPF